MSLGQDVIVSFIVYCLDSGDVILENDILCPRDKMSLCHCVLSWNPLFTVSKTMKSEL